MTMANCSCFASERGIGKTAGLSIWTRMRWRLARLRWAMFAPTASEWMRERWRERENVERNDGCC